MTIEEFIRRADLPVEVYNRVVNDFQSMDRKQWLQTWGDYMAENFNGWNEVDEVKQTKPLANRIANAFGDIKFAPKDRYKDDVYRAEFSDVPRDQFEAALSKMKEYYDAEVKGRRDQAMRKKREKEVKNWGLLRNLIASEYEKQRYVDNPNAALFGDQAPSIGSAPETRWGSAADLGLGTAGAVADLLPGWGGILAGPAIRGVRDVGHIVTDSPYQKELSQIGTDMLGDIGINAGANFLTNFRTIQRMGRGARKSNPVGHVVELDDINWGIANPDATELYYKLLDEVSGGSKTLLNTDIARIVTDLPESPMKAELMSMIGDLNHIDRTGMVKTMGKWRDLNAARGSSTISMLRGQIDNPTGAGVRQEQFGGIKFPASNDAYGQFFNKVVTEPKLSNGQQVMRMLMNTVTLSDRPVGAAVVKEGKTALGGRGTDPETVPTRAGADELNEIKDREARFWEAGFAPKKVDGDPLWEAYREWYIERTGDEPGGAR